MQASIGGAARVQGVGNVAGLQQSATQPATKCAIWLWLGAFTVLVIFHVGGSHL